MKKQRKGWSLMIPCCVAGAMALAVSVMSCNDSNAAPEEAKVTDEAKPIKVLYVTYEKGRWHDTTAQKGIFLEIANANGWKADIMTGSLQEMTKKLAESPDFGAGYDVIAYNLCFADCKDLRVPYNIIAQTKQKNIPALLIHGSLHSYWDTFKANAKNGTRVPGTQDKVYAKKGVLEKWTKENPDKEFPVWSNFTGIASTGHGPRKPIDVKVIKPDHVLAAGVKDYTTTPVSELYNNYITGKESTATTEVLVGHQGKKKATVLWEHPVGESKVVSFTLGHSNGEWKQAEFQQVIVNSVKHLSAIKRAAKK